MATQEQNICTGLNWIDITDPTASEMQALSNQYHLNPHTVKDCLEPEHLPKYELDEDVHFLILRFYAQPLNKTVTTIQELTNKIAIFYTDQFLITIHKASTPFLDTIRKKHVETKKCTTTTDVLAKIVWQALETFDEPANHLSEQVGHYEDQVMLKKTDTNLVESLYQIKRHTSVSHKVLMLMLEPINHIFPKAGEEAAMQDVRDQHLKMQTLYSQIMDDVNNLLNLSMSIAAQRTNDVMRILTLFSVFFMPLTFIAGIYGMNFEFMPELRQRWGYPAVLILMAVVALVIFQWFKRKKWL